MTQLLDGNALAYEFRKEITTEVNQLKKAGYDAPHLAAVLVGEDPASQAYVRNKVKDCQNVGFRSSLEQLPHNASQEELLELIHRLNRYTSVDGFIVQLPLPPHIDAQEVILAIHPDKDVDGFHPMNVGKMALDIETFLPATPSGILSLLKRYLIDTQGKHTVIIGRSAIVGKPMSILMARKALPGNSTVTLAHSFTPDVIKFTRQADIVITALGVPGFLKADMIRKNAVVIDVGVTRVKDNSSSRGYRLAGDVDFESVYGKASYLTPVPGGVGPLTRAMLLKNTLWAVKRRKF
ncbi:bifunctional 5,10-methylenetetrahydrofolate dehydrogenase/5,10-methenyltetrahydrofolate cyclohydrolase [Bacteroidetes bacterium endosymbiont of Geopemphigus sp.]|uniref:bifunctional 5,10-methylenetetrahydrofolate dehydrogenase/5,10-methenyltetrahydrofolate cyclohydrolase n=1 Tax=Bacteroidetes bacterium endosymbiont of Geopemphigus sp. TaxID=2047937 RepID=UPI000CD25E6B|nr:bifunctional 5,10-methylenetetrahydrofolate dehydrogenase/5,10-methenyltetrahydrofolate cyclohydrolase [Bacteroidetes bacterium endosymbiont of Geopemphigus sp.]